MSSGFFIQICFRICFRICITAICLFSLMGCCSSADDLNIFRDRSSDYKKSKVYPVLEVPEGTKREGFNDAYQIP